MKKTYCDLCKKEIELPKYKFLIKADNGCTINSIISIMDGIEYDLCDECEEKIMTYVNDIRRRHTMAKLKYYAFCIRWLYKNRHWRNTRQKWNAMERDWKKVKYK